MKFARFSFWLAAIYGLIVILPQYFLEEKNGRDFPPAITHPEYYYGFIGVVIAFQVVFLLIGKDPIRYRPIMIAAMIEKFSFAIAAIVLFQQGRLAPMMLGAGMIDLFLGILFVLAYFKTNEQTKMA